MNKNIKAGADLHAGDGGYSIGTQEEYDEFVRARNYSVSKARIQELAKQAGYTKDMFGVGHWDMPECKKFAELIINECAKVCITMPLIGPYKEVQDATLKDASVQIKQHFGVEE